MGLDHNLLGTPISGAQAPAEDEEGSRRDANENDGDSEEDDVFHAPIIPYSG